MIIAYWKLILLTLAITELAKDSVVKNKKALPWLAILVSIAVSLTYVWLAYNVVTWHALVRGLAAGLIATGIYTLVKDYVRAIKKA